MRTESELAAALLAVELAALSEEQERLELALQLPAGCDAIDDLILEGLSHAEMSRRLDIPVKIVKKYIDVKGLTAKYSEVRADVKRRKAAEFDARLEFVRPLIERGFTLKEISELSGEKQGDIYKYIKSKGLTAEWKAAGIVHKFTKKTAKINIANDKLSAILDPMISAGATFDDMSAECGESKYICRKYVITSGQWGVYVAAANAAYLSGQRAKEFKDF